MALDPSPLHEQWRILLEQRYAPYAPLTGGDCVALERGLFQALSGKEMGEAKMRIYRGLPRLYNILRPADARVKRDFSNLAQLKKLAVEKKIFQTYRTCPMPAHAKVSLFTWVRKNGWSDYFVALEAVEILQSAFPELELSWVVLFPSGLGSPIIPKGCKTHLLFYDRAIEAKQIKKEALAIFRTSDLIIQLPTFYPQFAELKAAVEGIVFSRPLPIWTSLGEYGFVESDRFHPGTKERAMGLHFLEKGVLLRKPHIERGDYALLGNTQLLRWLFNTDTPGLDRIEQYKETHHFYLADLQNPLGGAIYLHALLKAHERDQKGIDLCTLDLGWAIAYLQAQNQTGKPALEIEGVGFEIHLQGKVLPVAFGKKKLRLFCPTSLSQADFKMILRLSGEFAAIRDDWGFSEAVSENKGFFYDGKASSRYFMKDLSALAENRIRSHRNTLEIFRGMHQTFLHYVPKEDGQWVEETHFQEKMPWQEIASRLGVALQDPDAVVGFKKLNQVIAAEFSCNEFLCHLVQRFLCHRARPYHALIEEDLVNRFAQGEYSLAETVQALKQEIQHSI